MLDRVLRRPVLSAVVSGGALLALAVPALTMHTQLPSFTDLPKSLPIVRTYDSIQRRSPARRRRRRSSSRPTTCRRRRCSAAIAELERQRARERPDVQADLDRGQPGGHGRDRLDRARRRRQSNGASVAALQTLRDQRDPGDASARVQGVDAAVTGETAGTHDFNQQMKCHAPLVFAFVLALCFLLLLVTFRSIVIPIKAVLLNLLSVGAAYGLLVLVFQHRWAEGVLGFHSNGAITSWLPLFMFVILFGLSMDYHVFILSRVKELVDGGMPTERGGRDRDQAHRGDGDERGGRDGRGVRDLHDACGRSTSSRWASASRRRS